METKKLYPAISFRAGDMEDDLQEIKKKIEKENPGIEVTWSTVIRAMLNAYKEQQKVKAKAKSNRIWK